MREFVPPGMEDAVASFEEAMVDLRTTRIRGEALEIEEDFQQEREAKADDLAEAAAKPDAPKVLKALARAVEEGRTSWDDVLTGRANRVPEYQDMLAASMPMIMAEMEKAEADERAEERAEERKRRS